MKLSFFVISFFLMADLVAQSPAFKVWQEQSKTNKRLLPKYGNLPKSPGEIEADSSFIIETMAQPQFKTRRESSDHLIKLGFQYYYRPDFKTAMYRFNQAYLLDSTNTDIYWGYGAIYMTLGEYELAKTQYLTGLSIDSANTHLLTDLATYFMQQHRFDSATHYLSKSYLLNPKDVNTTYKLSVCFWQIKDCDNAWKYYDLTVALGAEPLSEEYTTDLKKRCKRN